VLRRRLVSALLLIVPAAAALSASVDIVRAIEECRLEPGLPAPSGRKWLSRINRDHLRCWYLSSRSIGGHHTQLRRAATVRNRHFAGDALRQGQQRDSDLQTASAPEDKTDIAVTAEPQAVPQVATPSVDQSSENLIPHSVPTITYRLPSPSAQTVSGPTGVVARSAVRTPAGASESNVVLLGGAAGLLFAGGVFHLTRRNHLRSRERVVAERHGPRRQVVVRSSVAAKPPPMTTNWAEDLKRKLHELERDRSDAPEACNLPRTNVVGSAQYAGSGFLAPLRSL
jgi:hypothetical protein